MPIHTSLDKKIIVIYDNKPINKYRPLISEKLIQEFGKGPFETEDITKALFYSLEWYTQEIIKILKSENDLAFFQGLFILHEYSCEFHRANPNKSPISQLSDQDFAMYRRVLKLCLEQGCDIPLKGGIPLTPSYLKSKENVIEDLLYLGDFVYMFSNLLAQQHLVEDCIDLKFTEDKLFYFDHKHHYGFIIDEIIKSIPEHLSKAVIDNNAFDDFIDAIKHCLGVEYDEAIATIQSIHNHFDAQGGKTVLDEWFIYPKNLENLFGIPYEKGKLFYSGLTLSKNNKLSIQEAVYKPQSINRYLYRPFLIWNVDGKDLTIVGDGIFIESISALCSNSFGWNKYPKEWGNECFQNFIIQKGKQNDKILEDVAEKLLIENSITYDRNLRSLKKWNNQNINIETSDCGEIDFIFLYDSKIFIADCKHQTARYDMNNFKNDYSSFETGNKSYNKTLTRKVDFFRGMLKELEEHFQVILNDRNFSLKSINIEGIFIVNTPTFIMYNNQYRIYTLKSFEELIKGEFIDSTYTLIIEGEEDDRFITVSYPYFKKPKYVIFKDDSDE